MLNIGWTSEGHVDCSSLERFSWGPGLLSNSRNIFQVVVMLVVQKLDISLVCYC